MPVTELQYIEGNSKQTDSSLLIAGGQVLDKPPILSLASLDTSFQVSPQLSSPDGTATLVTNKLLCSYHIASDAHRAPRMWAAAFANAIHE